MRRFAFALLLSVAASPAMAQDTLGVRLGITYTAGTRPGLVILPAAGLDSVRTIIARDLDYSDRFEVVTIPASEVAPPREGQVFYHELLGMRVKHADGGDVGVVTELYELPQGLTLEVRRSNGTALIPYREGMIVRTDRASREIVIDPPEGLLD